MTYTNKNNTFIDNVSNIYYNPSLRFNRDAWLNILNSTNFNYQSTENKLEIDLLYFINEHPYLSFEIYNLLFNFFNWNQRQAFINNNYPPVLYDLIFNRLMRIPNLSCKGLDNIDIDKLDEYIKLRNDLYFLAQDKHPSTVTQVNNLLAICPNDSELYRILGVYNVLNEQNDIAIEAFEKSLSLDSTNYFSKYYLGIEYGKKYRFKESYSLLSEVYNIDLVGNINSDKNFLLYYGLSSYYVNSLSESKKAFSKLKELGFNKSIANKYLRNINSRLDNKTNKIVSLNLFKFNTSSKRFIKTSSKVITKKVTAIGTPIVIILLIILRVYTKYQVLSESRNYEKQQKERSEIVESYVNSTIDSINSSGNYTIEKCKISEYYYIDSKFYTKEEVNNMNIEDADKHIIYSGVYDGMVILFKDSNVIEYLDDNKKLIKGISNICTYETDDIPTQILNKNLEYYTDVNNENYIILE